MKKQFVRKSLELTKEQWSKLSQIAATTNSLAPTGTMAGNPSWRTLLKQIADDVVVVMKSE